MKSRVETLSALMERAVPVGECFEWQGAISSSTGYGKVRVEGKPTDAHRAAWILAHGPIAPGLYVCHKCDNRKCVRLSHLFLGTHSDNMRDAASKGRLANNALCGEANPAAKLTESDVLDIFKLATSSRLTQAEIASKYGINAQRVSKIKLRQIWKALLTPTAPVDSASPHAESAGVSSVPAERRTT